MSIGSLLVFLSLTTPAQGAAVVTDLGSLGGPSGMAQGLNARGQVVGWAYTGGGLPHAFLAEGGRIQDLGTFGGTYSTASAINDAGQVAGQAATPDYSQHAFLYDGARLRDLGTLGGSYSAAYDVDASGRVVGVSTTPGDAVFHAFLHDGSRLRDLGTLGGSASVAYGINATGQVVGWSYPAGTANPHAFLYDGARLRDIGTLGGAASMAMALNDAGQVVGGSFPVGAGVYHAFLWERGSMHDLGTLGGGYSFAHAVNTAGQTVGESLLAGDVVQHAFLFSSGVMKDLNSLLAPGSDWVLSQALGINDIGQIVGVGKRAGQQRAFLLTPGSAPAPPPSAPAALAAEVVSAVEVDLHWADANRGETGFSIWRRTGGSDWSLVADIAPDLTSYTDSGLTPGTPYVYRVRAVNTSGPSAWSNEVNAATPQPPPTAPTSLTVAVASPTQLDLAWNDASSGETAFEVWRKTTTDDWTRIALVSPNTGGYSDAGLVSTLGCLYRVRAIGPGGVSDWSNMAGGPQPLAAPTELYVRNGAPYLVFLQWTDNSSAETGFELQRKVGDGVFRKLFILPKDQTTFFDYQMKPETTYLYRVRALGPGGPSAWSNELRWVTPPSR